MYVSLLFHSFKMETELYSSSDKSLPIKVTTVTFLYIQYPLSHYEHNRAPLILSRAHLMALFHWIH